VSALKPRPSAWDEPGCGCVSPIANGECWSCGRLALALWGHEWALVAWLAENEKRKGVLWEYLDSIRGLCTEADPYTLDTLPEDAMQLLCVNL
jgi:hypothetical protein